MAHEGHLWLQLVYNACRVAETIRPCDLNQRPQRYEVMKLDIWLSISAGDFKQLRYTTFLNLSSFDAWCPQSSSSFCSIQYLAIFNALKWILQCIGLPAPAKLYHPVWCTVWKHLTNFGTDVNSSIFNVLHHHHHHPTYLLSLPRWGWPPAPWHGDSAGEWSCSPQTGPGEEREKKKKKWWMTPKTWVTAVGVHSV